MADFAVLADVEKVLLLEITDPDQIASVNWALGVVSDAIRDYTEQEIERVSGDAIVLNGPVNSTTILLPEIPVVSVASVTESDVLLVVNTDFKLDPNLGILHRVGCAWVQGIQNLEIEYTHGYSPIPDTINGICARAASRLFQAALKSAENLGLPGVASKSLGDFAVSFAVDTGDGQMGASSARVLLMSEKDLLDKYRAK